MHDAVEIVWRACVYPVGFRQFCVVAVTSIRLVYFNKFVAVESVVLVMEAKSVHCFVLHCRLVMRRPGIRTHVQLLRPIVRRQSPKIRPCTTTSCVNYF